MRTGEQYPAKPFTILKRHNFRNGFHLPRCQWVAEIFLYWEFETYLFILYEICILSNWLGAFRYVKLPSRGWLEQLWSPQVISLGRQDELQSMGEDADSEWRQLLSSSASNHSALPECHQGRIWIFITSVNVEQAKVLMRLHEEDLSQSFQ